MMYRRTLIGLTAAVFLVSNIATSHGDLVLNGDFTDESNWVSGDITQLNAGDWLATDQTFGVRFDTSDASGTDLDLAQVTVTNGGDNRSRSIGQLIDLTNVAAGDLTFSYDVNYVAPNPAETNRRWNVALYGISDDTTPGFSIASFTELIPFGTNSNVPAVSGATISVIAFEEPGFASGDPQPDTGGFVTETIDFMLAEDQYDYLLVRLSARVNASNGELVQYDNVSVTSVTAVPEPSSMTLVCLGGIAITSHRRRRNAK